ncbi:ParB N-terminal domain-containing protein [Companilactobacillus allii]|uniref:ParB-like N-terminal domain-containing protein n=1 Tax=Companilactobacillus allii TaxID=1847728 RepID=A0A1P8Q2L8_9LACO|nr:ParB N-terminal domain-containing protein [Companilactobacillus allii]APX72067.1 hypothetical protein BTM29_05595 [Companilactobacillus allii]USQ69160.1 ParB N-terminal domain-containing protein [Companilactobacillus allii]
MNEEMKIQVVSIDSITPYPDNPRNNDDAVEPTAESIKQFGWQQPIVVDKNNVVIAGHTRLKAAEKLGLETVPIVVADLSDEQARAYRLADNKTGEMAYWDDKLLDQELSKITDIDMNLVGFNLDDIEPELPQDFFEENPDSESDSDTKNYLEWGSNKVLLSQNDIKILDDQFKKFNDGGENGSFVTFLVDK